MTQDKIFNPEIEIAHYKQDPAHLPSIKELDALDSDMYHWIPNFPDLFQNKVILDLASGRGLAGILIQRKFSPKQVVCLDISYNRLTAASPWRDQLNDLDLCCASAFNLPYQDETFDFVLANSFLHHIPNLELVAKEIARVLRPNGMYIGREPNFNNPLVRWTVFSKLLKLLAGASPVLYSDNEYPLRSQKIESTFKAAGCRPELHYFWRRLPGLHHPLLSVAISVRAYRQ